MAQTSDLPTVSVRACDRVWCHDWAVCASCGRVYSHSHIHTNTYTARAQQARALTQRKKAHASYTGMHYHTPHMHRNQRTNATRRPVRMLPSLHYLAAKYAYTPQSPDAHHTAQPLLHYPYVHRSWGVLAEHTHSTTRTASLHTQHYTNCFTTHTALHELLHYTHSTTQTVPLHTQHYTNCSTTHTATHKL